MEISSFSFFLALFIFKSIPLISTRTIPNFTTDQEALLSFKNTLNSDPSSTLINNWSTNTSICNWTGVSCGAKHQRVTALNVSGLALRGNLAPHLGNLTFLQSLDISSNNFSGFIPSQLSKLRRLTYINMGANNFVGEIPSWFEALAQLQYMYLNNNTFSGKFPPSLFNISSLIEINMMYNKLSGELPNDICSNTPKLEALYLSRNQLYGKIPANIYKCRELRDLRLAYNQINGSIPSEIGSLSMLRSLNLYTNELEGSIPEQLGNLTSLQSLDLGANKLTGRIPHQLENSTSLKSLSLSGNYLTGELPQELASLIQLEELGLMNNSLSGSIPSSIFNISTLKRLGLGFNQFSGTLPSNMGSSLFNLEELYLTTSGLGGPIPSSINNASNLSLLDMSNNSFTGSIPNFDNLRLLRSLFIWGNNLSGAKSPTQELQFLSSLTNCRHLASVFITSNPLNGILPSSIGNLSESLESFGASACNIKGGIPSEIGNLSSLREVYLNENELAGALPTTIRKLERLQRLALTHNLLQGHIPNEICDLNNLGELDLSFNMLTSGIPQCLGDLKNLRHINLGSNKLNSTIPSNLWNLRDLLKLNLSSNYLSGQLSSQITNLKVVFQIDLSSNILLGDIPSLIGSCQSIEILSLSGNKFKGSIPQSLENLKGLVRIDLSNNSLSGWIPKSLKSLRFLEYFNVSYNKLEGEIPNEGCFVNFTPQSFIHNSALCGAPRFQVPPCPESRGASRSESVRLVKYIVPSLISAIILVIITLVLVARSKTKRSPLSAAVDTSLGIEWRRISYIELERGTSSFSETNVLGTGSYGSVFKAILSDGITVAVKVFNLDLEQATKSFDTESEILSNARHRNLIRVIGCCTNMEFRALILEYMPNGSLEKWLYSENYCLDLLQSLRIAIDVALALEYLHHGHTFPIVHCDVKPSNVLLDEDMTARVADFGISKLFDEEAMIQTNTLATIGYAAPEYGSEGIVSTSADVYSYGVMLLEMFTRKKPTDDMFNGEMCLKEWVSEALQANAISQVVAPALLSEEDRHFVAKEECVASVFELAMKCLAISPDERIDMIEAASILKKIKAKVAAEVTSMQSPLLEKIN